MNKAPALARTLHVVDRDHAMRATLSRAVTDAGMHAEIYDSLTELAEAAPATGAILMADPGGKFSDLIGRLFAERIYLPLVAFSERPSASRVIRAAHEGVADYIGFPFEAGELVAAYDYSQRWVERNSGSILRQQSAQEQVSLLSDRERQVLALLLDGHSNKSIAVELDLSPRTVEDYRLNAIRKLGVASTSAAIRIGIEAGLDTLFFTTSATRMAPGPAAIRTEA